MKRINLLFLISFLFIDACLATQSLYPNDGLFGLHYRGKVPHPSEDSCTLIVEENMSDDHFSKIRNAGDVKDAEIDEEAIFSCLGEVWEAFKDKNFNDYYYKLRQLEVKDQSPEACYLLGLIYEKGLGRIAKTKNMASEHYTLAMTYSEQSHPLYSMSLSGLERCKIKCLERLAYYKR